MFDPTQMVTIDTLLENGFQLVFYVLLGIYAVFSAVFYYHWQAYSNNAFVMLLTFAAYLASTVPLLITMASISLI